MDSQANFSNPPLNLALVWRPASARNTERMAPLTAALATTSVRASHLAFDEAEAAAFERQLASFDGALVWVNPLQDGQDRSGLDAILRRASSAGLWVSAHPDVIGKIGVKSVLHATRGLGWGADTRLYETAEALRRGLAPSLAAGETRVLKPDRGNDGQGVWKVRAADGVLEVQPVGQAVERLSLDGLVARLEPVLGVGRLIDQPFFRRAAEGMVRCYLSEGEVVGFSEQSPRAEGEFGMISAKTMHGADAPAFKDLRRAMETDWVPGLRRLLDIAPDALPALWDADFLRGETGFVLCEINASAVSPFPEAAVGRLAATAARQLTEAKARRDPAVRTRPATSPPARV